MKYTGERVIPKTMNPHNRLLKEHIYHYEFTRKFARGRVMDIACGSSYGSEIILESNDNVIAYVELDFRSNLLLPSFNFKGQL